MNAPIGAAVIVQRVGAALAALPIASAVVGLGGAHAKGQADALSDVDFYVFGTDIPAGERLMEGLAAHLPDAADFQTWSGTGEAGIDFRLDGQVVEIWFRETAQVLAAAERALAGRFEKEDRVWTPNGFYQSTVLADLMAMQVLGGQDPDFAGLLERILDYPEPLRRAAFEAGLAPQRFWRGNMHLETAIARLDRYYLESILHQMRSGLIQSAFALNRKYFGGDKKMGLSLRQLPVLPGGFERTILDPSPPDSIPAWRSRFDALFALADELCVLIGEGTA
ncbi:MAG: hypothetical protein ABS76_06330 [Pelagibacterium sp. SCN 64-44]|nr:MAG: hypothetical protein ABS76_06330 [Pelagibacterium sp. SCN 64-44]